MEIKKLNCNHAIKKQITTVVIAVVLLAGYVFVTGFNSKLEWVTGGFLFTITVIALYRLLKKQSKEISCPHCNRNIYKEIKRSMEEGSDFCYCPSCRNKVGI